MSWYNYKTQDYEYIETPADFTDYIPQHPAAQGLYRCHLALGDAPIKAAMKVLSAAVGEPVKESESATNQDWQHSNQRVRARVGRR